MGEEEKICIRKKTLGLSLLAVVIATIVLVAYYATDQWYENEKVQRAYKRGEEFWHWLRENHYEVFYTDGGAFEQHRIHLQNKTSFVNMLQANNVTIVFLRSSPTSPLFFEYFWLDSRDWTSYYIQYQDL